MSSAASTLPAPGPAPSSTYTSGTDTVTTVSVHTPRPAKVTHRLRSVQERRLPTASPSRTSWPAVDLATLDIPAPALRAYQLAAYALKKAAPDCGLDWTLLAAIGRVESDHGRYAGAHLGDDGVSSPLIRGVPLNGRHGVSRIPDTDAGRLDGDRRWDRAVGPMQFIPSTWAYAGVDADGDGVRNPDDLDDAALAAAVYLCAGGSDLGSRHGRAAAVYSYNASSSYVAEVLRIARAYRTGQYRAPALPVITAITGGALQATQVHRDRGGPGAGRRDKQHQHGDQPKGTTGGPDGNGPGMRGGSGPAGHQEPGTQDPKGDQPPGDDPSGDTQPPKQPPAGDPPTKNPPSNDPPGSAPPGSDPPGSEPPGNQPPGNQPPGNQPPGNQPPGNGPEQPPTDPPAGDPPGNDPPAECPDPFTPAEPPETVPPLTDLTGTLTACDDGVWMVGDIPIDVGDEDWLAATALNDLDGDNAVETNLDELTGLVGADVDVQVAEGTGDTGDTGAPPPPLYTVNTLDYRPTSTP